MSLLSFHKTYILSLAPLLSAEKVQYSALIDVLFEGADLETITARQIRKALAAELGKDISSQKVNFKGMIQEFEGAQFSLQCRRRYGP